MPDNKLSAKEAALIAQARAELGKKPAARAHAPQTAPLARNESTPTAAAIGSVAPIANKRIAAAAIERVAAINATPAPVLDPAERVAALLAAARAETERLRLRQRKRYLWAPAAVIAATALWMLVWMWLKL